MGATFPLPVPPPSVWAMFSLQAWLPRGGISGSHRPPVCRLAGPERAPGTQHCQRLQPDSHALRPRGANSTAVNNNSALSAAGLLVVVCFLYRC